MARVSSLSHLGRCAKTAWQRVLELDNNIIGFFVCAIAAYSWLAFYVGISHLLGLYSRGFYGLLLLSTATASISAVYLTLAGIVLLFLKRPISRYNEVAPNLIAIVATFAAYMFLVTPHGTLVHVNVYVPLSLIVSGILVTTISLLYLRQAFSVTPQARSLVTAGPYSVVRHPMYVGNILSLLGVALLIDSWQALGLLFICGSLQVRRALYEESLLEANFTEYAEYKNRVGRFIPRFNSRRRLASARPLAAA